MQIAREMLASGKQDTHLERFSLGASLGQCCGGATVLLFEPMGQVQAQIAVFGAGHVGRALVPFWPACPAGCAGSTRGSRNSPTDPHGVRKIVSEEPVDEIDDLPAGSYCIVMTHNHQLDLELTAAILKRNDFAYFGLIGSKTKRVKFEHRLRERGFDARVQRMRCPMGLGEVKGKLPVEIAISIAGEIIATYNATSASRPPAPNRLPNCCPFAPQSGKPQRDAMPLTRKAYRAAILHSIADPAEVGIEASYEYFEDGLLVVDNGKISASATPVNCCRPCRRTSRSPTTRMR
jgi:xanthine dehydrogenase accessory factor